MIVAEGRLNPAKLSTKVCFSRKQPFNARIPLETEEEKRRALHDVILKENSICIRV